MNDLSPVLSCFAIVTPGLESFAITGALTGPPRYLVTVRSAQGGELDISVLGNGDIVAAEDP